MRACVGAGLWQVVEPGQVIRINDDCHHTENASKQQHEQQPSELLWLHGLECTNKRAT